MADELNSPSHRWHEPRNNIALPPEDYSRHYIYDTGIQKIDAWINSQPWGNPAVYLPFIPSGSNGLITADSLTFRVVASEPLVDFTFGPLVYEVLELWDAAFGAERIDISAMPSAPTPIATFGQELITVTG